jgi:hypothetical protein
MATAGKTKPTKGTKIVGRKEAAIMNYPLLIQNNRAVVLPYSELGSMLSSLIGS